MVVFKIDWTFVRAEKSVAVMTSKFELHVIDTAYDTLDIKRKDLWGQLSRFHIKLKNTWNCPQNTRVHEIVSNIFNTFESF